MMALACVAPAPGRSVAQGVMAPVLQSTGSSHSQKPAPAARTPAAAPVVPQAPGPQGPIAQAPIVQAPNPQGQAFGAVTKEPIPRFMALRFDEVNLRVGPGTNYPISWVYHRRDLPVEVLAEIGDWRKLQDQDQVVGWVKASSLWKRRSVVVVGADQTMHAKADDTAADVAKLRVGVVLHVLQCPAGGAWCEVEINAYRGWIKRAGVYGLYPNEAIDG